MNHRSVVLALAASLAFAVPAAAQQRDEGAMFGAPAGVGSAAPEPSTIGPQAKLEDGGSAPDVDAGVAAAAAHNEDSIFGGAPAAPPPATAAATTAPATAAAASVVGTGEHAGAEGSMFGTTTPHDPETGNNGSVPMNPLTVGGLLYLQSQVTGGFTQAGNLQPPSQWTTTMPNLLDVYLDARPNDDVRGMVVGRLEFNPMTNPNLTLPGQPAQPTTAVFLDQMWLNFNVYHQVFLTVGKQHIKWGTGHFWNPTDFLQPVKLDPLALYDTRLGVTMIKAHIPWEKEGWNFYGFALLDNGPDPTINIGNVGGAGRAEIVLGPTEIGFDGVWRNGQTPRYGTDISAGVGPFDLYGEAAFQDPRVLTEYELQNNQFVPSLGLANFESYHPTNSIASQVVLGGSWQTTIADNDALTIGAEYFYNSLGVTNSDLYPYLLLKNAFTPFYTGVNYVGAYAALAIPSSNGFASNNFTLSNLGNLSDDSFIVRLDYNVLILTHLQLEVYVDSHYGHNGGEFRFGIDTTGLTEANGAIPPIFVPTPLFDTGINLRVSI